MPHSASRFRYDSLLPTQVYSCFNGVTVLTASLFSPPYNLRFRSQDGLDIHSECYLLARDIWEARSPLRLDGTPPLGKTERKEARGARIQVVPRASVGYRVEEYEKARQDRNTTAFEVDGAEKREAERREMVEWDPWPLRPILTVRFSAVLLPLSFAYFSPP
jgi:hypothetical protein